MKENQDRFPPIERAFSPFYFTIGTCYPGRWPGQVWRLGVGAVRQAVSDANWAQIGLVYAGVQVHAIALRDGGQV